MRVTLASLLSFWLRSTYSFWCIQCCSSSFMPAIHICAPLKARQLSSVFVMTSVLNWQMPVWSGPDSDSCRAKVSHSEISQQWIRTPTGYKWHDAAAFQLKDVAKSNEGGWDSMHQRIVLEDCIVAVDGQMIGGVQRQWNVLSLPSVAEQPTRAGCSVIMVTFSMLLDYTLRFCITTAN